MRIILVGALASLLWFACPASSDDPPSPDLEEMAGPYEGLQRAGALVTVISKNNPLVVRVSLSGVKNADKLLDDVKKLYDLVTLELAGTNVTDDDLRKLGRLRKLRSLNLASTRVTDKGLAHVKELTSLNELSLFGTRVSDDGIRQLNGLLDLQTLVVNETRVSAKGAQALQEALPDLHVIGVK